MAYCAFPRKWMATGRREERPVGILKLGICAGYSGPNRQPERMGWMNTEARPKRQSHSFEVNAILWVAKASEEQIRGFFVDTVGVKKNRLQSDLHLTVYHGRRVLPTLTEQDEAVTITLPTVETRFMVLAPGGENPRADLDLNSLPVGIRLTKRNSAIHVIQDLRRQIYSRENKRVLGQRSPTTAWRNAFGSRHYQPHIQLLKPWHKISAQLTEFGELFRSQVDVIEFDRFQIAARHRINGKWVKGSMTSLPESGYPALTDEQADRLRERRR